MRNKTLGCTLLIIGTSIGAGMLALPLASGRAGLELSAMILIGIWALMTYTGLLVLEVNTSAAPDTDNFSSMAQNTAGPIARSLAWICIICLLYSLTWAYISGGASLLGPLVNSTLTWCNIPGLSTPQSQLIGATLFTTLLGFTLWHSTAAVDAVNRSFISLKMILLIICMSLLLPHIHTDFLRSSPQTLTIGLGLAPIFLASFGYHTVIPSLTQYYNNAKQLKTSIIIGTSVPLALYLLWLICTLGLVPTTGHLSFSSLAHSGNTVGQFTQALISLTKNRWIDYSITAFTNIALVTSFLGVTLGLFDFIAGVFDLQDTKLGRLQTTALTLGPPLLLFFFLPNGFLLALKCAALFVVLLEVILPAWMVQCLRKKGITSNYRAPGGMPPLLLCYVMGFFLIITTIISLY